MNPGEAHRTMEPSFWRPLWAKYFRGLRPLLPSFLHRATKRAYWIFVRTRLSAAATRWLGPRYRRNREFLEIDITWACNLACEQCNRSIDRAPTGEHMSVGQVRLFLEESRASNYRWRRITLTGGEPTLHPQFFEILQLLADYRRHSPGTGIRVTTNGYGERVRGVLERIPAFVEICNSAKESNHQPAFATISIAPMDLPTYDGVDFSNGCRVARDCGTGLSPNGYYPCPLAGALDRIFGLDLGRKSLPAAADGMEDLLREFCPKCGFFRLNHSTDAGEIPLTTPSWQRAHEAWRRRQPRLTRLPEA